MADEQDAGDRTEQPTPKKLQDARKRGDVSRSRDVGATVGMLAFTLLTAGLATFTGARLAALFEQAVGAIGRPFEVASAEMLTAAGWTVVTLTLAVAMPIALLGLMAEFLQVGPIFTGKKLEPKFENLDPVKGIKRMFSLDNLVEIVKSVLKTIVLLTIAAFVARGLLPEIATLPLGGPGAFGEALRSSWIRLAAWTLSVFAVISIADVLYQRYSYLKRLRMSMREIRREHKEDQGDPLFKQHRRQQHQELSSGSAVQLARGAHMLVVNPTHVAIALDYDPKRCPVPTVAAKGEDALALSMRKAARDAGVPMLRDIPLARALLERATIGEIVPDDLFEAVAKAVVWARKARAQVDEGSARPAGRRSAAGTKPAPRSPDAQRRPEGPKRPSRPSRPKRPPQPPAGPPGE
jgi:type III secretion protein U